MILKASQRGGARQLGMHLLKDENEHVEVHDIRGFISDDVLGALKEAQAVAMGTKCKQFLFSVSLNPPKTEYVHTEVFEQAISRIEEKHNLAKQARIIIFHEKEGRRHCHAIWSRIDVEEMKAVQLSHYKLKMREISKQIYLENGWKMPRGLVDSKERDPRNFTLAEWQQSKRTSYSAKEIKSIVQECWAISDSRPSLEHALEERGLYLAQGRRKSHVAMTFEGEVFAIARTIKKKQKEVTERLGDPKTLRDVEETKVYVAQTITPKLQIFIQNARTERMQKMALLDQKRLELRDKSNAERMQLSQKQKLRKQSEIKLRAERFRKGFKGLWDRLSGKHRAIRKQNEMELQFSNLRDQKQQHDLRASQMLTRQALQTKIETVRKQYQTKLKDLHYDLKKHGHPQAMQKPVSRLARLEQFKNKRRNSEKPIEPGRHIDFDLDR